MSEKVTQALDIIKGMSLMEAADLKESSGRRIWSNCCSTNDDGRTNGWRRSCCC